MTRSTIACDGIDTITTPNGSTRFRPKAHGQEEAGRRNARDLKPGEAQFMHLRNGGSASSLSAAAIASYQNLKNAPFEYVSLAAQGLYPDEGFIAHLLWHIERAHKHEGALLGISMPDGTHAEVAGTALLRFFQPNTPPPSYVPSKKNKVSSDPLGAVPRAARHAASSIHTDGTKDLHELYQSGGALHGVSVDDDDDDDDDDSDDGEEHDEDADDDGYSRFRAVLNTGVVRFSMYLHVPIFEAGKHVASNRPDGRNEQFQSLEIELQPGDIFIFSKLAGALLTHQAVLTTDAPASFVVLDYCFAPGAPRSPPAAPTEAPQWTVWRHATKKARNAKSDRASKEHVLNPLAHTLASH